MNQASKVALVLALALPCIACDQATKAIAQEALGDGRIVLFLDGVVRLQLAMNSGGFLSLGASLPDFARFFAFLVLGPIGIVSFTVLLLRTPSSPLNNPGPSEVRGFSSRSRRGTAAVLKYSKVSQRRDRQRDAVHRDGRGFSAAC